MNDEVSAFTDESKFARHIKPLASFIILISHFVIACLLPTAAVPKLG
ncbi:hypothetical protein [Rheinheimera sp. EpRS3]|nr:hypothetical protein [Rheinheimera sp. EpRS3]